MLDASFNLEGVDEALAKMKQVEELPRKRSTRFALRKAAAIVRENVAARAARLDDPKTAESIAANVVVRYDGAYMRQTRDMKMSVGILGGSTSRFKNQANPGGDTYYWRFLEFGTAKMPAVPFMRPGMEESIEPATDEFLQQFDKALVRAIRRANRGR
ncbi:HK97-gp10 family putative phage morphogenesis protein [Halomonas getboli]|uniref:HK97-gp10 family putative phage morphogenesis protein n=1 Tax=Halomonas getboli TaxID=2935862 RepID=UPI001FFED63A|nr:HK97-gp10 family putative phage morphogenesis protein [Halomonas getboli]MCK2183507.1 HK97 gp10 family phage protein [Halomonas getboli]